MRNSKARRVVACITSMFFMSFFLTACIGNTNESAVSDNSEAEYEVKLFDTSYVHTINISISEEDWNDLITNPLDKTKYEVNITIDGETINNVSFATKGNTSLSSVASDQNSSRYSFKINFGKYVDGQTYYGLNKLNLNNIYADATYMKDYLSYEIFRQAGVDSPLASYVWLTVNDTDYGLYLALEDISSSYLERTNDGEGELYKPETEQLGNMDKAGGGMQMQRPDNMNFQPPQMQDCAFPEFSGIPDGSEPPVMPEISGIPEAPAGFEVSDGSEVSAMPEAPSGFEIPDGTSAPNGFSGFERQNFSFGGAASNGADLSYSDDDINSYADIFDNAVTNADDEDKQRVIAALKGLSEGNNLEEYLDTDEIIRYFAAHNFVLNYDSYTGNMLHNYYLYEKNGKLSMLPWDYNLAFGGFSGIRSGSASGDATSLLNTGIDTPLSGTDNDSRPMWSWITGNEQYLEQYHNVYDELISGYFESGEFEKQIDALYDMLLPYVEKDPTAFYSADEFKTAYNTLKQFCLTRAESIRAQLDGILSTETDKQDSTRQISASDININDMGSQGGMR